MSTGRPILFLGGAGLPAWIWDDVRRHLGQRHETQVAARPDDPTRLDDYVGAAIASAPDGEFVIVAHSSGGVIATEVARLLGERVVAILGISAVFPSAGASFMSSMPAPNRWMLGAVMRLAGTRPPESAIRRGVAHGLGDPVVERIVADFTPESPALYRDRVGDRSWIGWSGYVSTADDRELPHTLQARFAHELGAGWSGDLPTGHLPMLEDPRAVAATIVRFIEARPGSAAPPPTP